ncbi:unnamed protein product [Caenorhabditis auriculariae]|uniref:Uncharacterized protein n=1 Tax=Caenorhabditis auriculariae TaxID=2777116 RepID=A0A8S1GVG0_9PELO|nr:unnamed protein product [Caenorhabditis auriculariae]
MVYVDKDGRVIEKKKGVIEMIMSFFAMLLLFFQSIIGMDRPSTSGGYRPTANDHRSYLRQNDNNGLGGGSSGRGGGGGSSGGGSDGFRRNIGRLPGFSGVAPPPMSGGCCGGGGCG